MMNNVASVRCECHILHGGNGYRIVAVAQSGIHFVYPSVNQESLNSSISEWDHRQHQLLRRGY
jgi:hypothetical protein